MVVMVDQAVAVDHQMLLEHHQEERQYQDKVMLEEQELVA
jgi:hypothetical protein